MLTLVEASLRPNESPIGEALRLATQELRPKSGDSKIAMGWHYDPGPEGTSFLYHHGAMLGFWSYVGFSPEAGVGVVALANSRDPSISELGEQLLIGLSKARRESESG